MDDIYKEQIIDHYKNPRNFGELEGADPSASSRQKGGQAGQVVVVKEANASCGDLFELALKFEGERVGEVKFRGVGCAISMAAFSMLTEEIIDHRSSIIALERLTDKDMVEMLGIRVSPTRMKCAALPLRALKRALKERISQ